MPASPLKIINCHYWDGFSPEPGWEVKDDFCCFGRRRSSIRPVASVVDRLGRIKKGTKEQTLRHWSGAQIEKRQKHTHTMHYFCDDKLKPKERLKIWLCWTLTGLQLHSHHSSFYGPSGLIDGGFAVLVCCWALKLCLIQSGMTFIVGDYLDSLKTIFFFFFIDVDHYEANRKIYIFFFFF